MISLTLNMPLCTKLILWGGSIGTTLANFLMGMDKFFLIHQKCIFGLSETLQVLIWGKMEKKSHNTELRLRGEKGLIHNVFSVDICFIRRMGKNLNISG